MGNVSKKQAMFSSNSICGCGCEKKMTLEFSKNGHLSKSAATFQHKFPKGHPRRNEIELWRHECNKRDNIKIQIGAKNAIKDALKNYRIKQIENDDKK